MIQVTALLSLRPGMEHMHVYSNKEGNTYVSVQTQTRCGFMEASLDLTIPLPVIAQDRATLLSVHVSPGTTLPVAGKQLACFCFFDAKIRME